jgi:predicted AAA+ superfamily ATPase
MSLINPDNELSPVLIQELHRMNPWWNGDSIGTVPKFKRSIYQSLYESVTRGHYKIVALRGPRQVGKTVLQMQMIQELLKQKQVVSSPQQIFRVQFEDLSYLDFADPLLTIIRWYENNIIQDTFNNMAEKGLPVYIFLDEFQSIKNWNSQLKHISDHGECKFFVTGSSALRIIAGKESMAGRVHWNEINSLGLAEISAFRKTSPLSPYQSKISLSDWLKKDFWLDLKNADQSPSIDQIYESFCDFGGYPFCHKGKEVPWEDVEEYLCDTVVAKTIQLDLKAKFESMYGGSTAFMDSTLLTNAFRVLCKFTGQDVSIGELGKELIASCSVHLKHDQVRMILEFFELSMLIKIVRPSIHRLKNSKECVKICLCDHAIRKAWLKEDVPLYGTDINANLAGHVIEGIIGNFFKSIKQLGVSYFPPVRKGKEIEESEVDFILEIGAYHIPVEVKYKNKPDLGKGLKSFLCNKAYNAPFGLVITKDEHPVDYFKDERIIPISAKKLLLLK